jgi:hypothetical protein
LPVGVDRPQLPGGPRRINAAVAVECWDCHPARVSGKPVMAADTRSDSQFVELLGRYWLVTELLRAGIEIAEPVRDKGVDLIAYARAGEGRFVARPIQLKASMATMFGLDRTYEKMPSLLLVHVWHLADPQQTRAYALTYQDALQIADAMRWTISRAWRDRGRYVNNEPGAEIRKCLDSHRMAPERWREKLFGDGMRPELLA